MAAFAEANEVNIKIDFINTNDCFSKVSNWMPLKRIKKAIITESGGSEVFWKLIFFIRDSKKVQYNE